MLLFFINLYISMFTGTWTTYQWYQIVVIMRPLVNLVGEFTTSIFGDNNMANLGDILPVTNNIEDSFVMIIAFVLALITSIGIVVMAVKGVKKAFGIFFMGVNRL